MTRTTFAQGTRVRVALRGGDVLYGYYRGNAPTGEIWVQEEGQIAERKVFAHVIEEAQLICPSCHEHVNKLGSTGECVACLRRTASPRDTVQHCDVCGATPAYRNPQFRSDPRFKCGSCHAATGTEHDGTRVWTRQGVCSGLPHDDPRHVWVRVRGSRYRCSLCEADSYGARS